MKTVSSCLMFVAVLSTTSMASASSYFEYCSDAQGTVKYQSGHIETKLELTQSKWNGQKQRVSKVVLNDEKFRMTELKSAVLSESSTPGSCDKDNNIQFSSSKTTEYRSVRIERPNGSLFPEDTVGVTKDRRAVTAELICEIHISNLMFCE